MAGRAHGAFHARQCHGGCLHRGRSVSHGAFLHIAGGGLEYMGKNVGGCCCHGYSPLTYVGSMCSCTGRPTRCWRYGADLLPKCLHTSGLIWFLFNMPTQYLNIFLYLSIQIFLHFYQVLNYYLSLMIPTHVFVFCHGKTFWRPWRSSQWHHYRCGAFSMAGTCFCCAD